MSTLTYTPESLESCELQLLRCSQSIEALVELEAVGGDGAAMDAMARAILSGQITVSNESLKDLHMRAFQFAMGLVHKILELLERLWNWLTEKVNGLRRKVKREKARTEKRKDGKPTQARLTAPNAEGEARPSDEQAAGTAEDLRANAEVDETAEEAMEENEEAITGYLDKVNGTLESKEVSEGELSEETLEKLRAARQEYLNKGAESKAVKNAPVLSRTALEDGGERTIRLLTVLGDKSLLTQTDRDSKGEVIRHEQFRGPTPEAYQKSKPSHYEAATANEILEVLSAYEKLLDELDKAKKQVPNKDLRRYHKSMQSLQRVVKGKVSRGELDQEKIRLLMTEVNSINNILSQISLRERTLPAHQIKAIREGLRVIEVLRSNLSKD